MVQRSTRGYVRLNLAIHIFTAFLLHSIFLCLKLHFIAKTFSPTPPNTSKYVPAYKIQMQKRIEPHTGSLVTGNDENAYIRTVDVVGASEMCCWLDDMHRPTVVALAMKFSNLHRTLSMCKHKNVCISHLQRFGRPSASQPADGAYLWHYNSK